MKTFNDVIKVAAEIANTTLFNQRKKLNIKCKGCFTGISKTDNMFGGIKTAELYLYFINDCNVSSVYQKFEFSGKEDEQTCIKILSELVSSFIEMCSLEDYAKVLNGTYGNK